MNLDEVCVQATHLEARGKNDTHGRFQEDIQLGRQRKEEIQRQWQEECCCEEGRRKVHM